MSTSGPAIYPWPWTTCTVCGVTYQGTHPCGGSPSATGGVQTCADCGTRFYVSLGHICCPSIPYAPAPLTADQVRQIIREEIEAARERDAK